MNATNKKRKFDINDIVISNATGQKYRVVDLPNKNRSGYRCTDKDESLYLFFEDEIELFSEDELYQEDLKFRQLERVYRQTQNHREELGSVFVKLVEDMGLSIEEWLGLQIEREILRADSQRDRRYADDRLKAACGHNFEELVELIKDN